MKAIIAGLLAVALLIAGCSSSSKKPTPTVAPSPITPTQRYIAILRTANIGEDGVSQYSDDQLIATGQEVCSILANPSQQSYSANPVDDLVRAGWETLPAEAVESAAKATLC